MPSWDEIKAGIFAGESGGDYNALFGFSNRPGGRFANTRLTDMTVDEAIQFADPNGPYAQWVKGQIGRVATPMGGFQVVGSTLKQAKDWAGLTGNELMTPELQDKLGQAILAKQGTGAWEGYRGPRTPGTTINSLPAGYIPPTSVSAPPMYSPPTATTETAAVTPATPPTEETPKWEEGLRELLGSLSGGGGNRQQIDTTDQFIPSTLPSLEAGDAARIQAAQTLMSSILASRRRPRGLSLTGVPNAFSS